VECWNADQRSRRGPIGKEGELCRIFAELQHRKAATLYYDASTPPGLILRATSSANWIRQFTK
jgi:hypothetical protein